MHLKVEVGDIISEIDGKVTHAMTPEMVAKVVKSTGGKRPINMSVTKTHSKECKVCNCQGKTFFILTYFIRKEITI